MRVLYPVGSSDLKWNEISHVRLAGDLSNDFLLMDYGFLIPDNPHDTVQLRFDPGLIEVRGAGRQAGWHTGGGDRHAGRRGPLRLVG